MKEKCNTSKANTEDQVQHSHNTDSDFSSSSKQNTIFSSSLDNTLSDSSSERSGATFINKTPGNSTNSIRNSSPSKITATTPVVVVQSCSSSPAHSGVATSSQTKINSKVNKPKSKPVGKTTPTTNTVKVSTLPKPQQKPQEDEQTTQRIYAILDKYAEQLRNSPELKNKPAPRRRSNPSSNSSQSSKRKKTSQNKTKATSSLSKCSGVELSPGSEDVLTVGSEDSSNGLSQISQVMSSPQSHLDELSTPTGDVSSETSESLDSKEPRLQHRSLITESGKGSARTVVVQENVQDSVNVVDTTKVFDAKQVVGNSGTVPLTLSLPGAGNLKQVIFPMPADGRQFVVAKMPKMYRVHQVSGSPLLATTGSGAVVLRQMCINKAGTNIKQVKVPVVTSISPQNVISKQPTVVLPSGTQTFTLATNSCTENTESLGIAFDNTLLLNASTAGSSISFVQRNLAKPLLPTSGLVATTSLSPIQDSSVSVPSSTSDITVTTLKSENASVSTTCAPSKTDNDGKSGNIKKKKTS
ncbi:hypothetical protein AAG570_008132 [Ranatra chinensis]|uniref:Uncharacterized protein n=1 Tax=Ranatra chinensis TaxID=642074 RepID=A0ABD0XTZ7_9HEMI